MLPRVVLDTAEIPGSTETLRLIQRGSEFSIMLGAVELMNSRLSGSEEALATLACAQLATREAPAILIGGLGMGFTLRAALAVLPHDAQVTVAELVPKVVEWASGPTAALHGESLSDRRTAIVLSDVATCIRTATSDYDAILLDVDNGPDGLTATANDWLYSRAGLNAAKAALRPGGVLAVWSAASDVRFADRLRTAGFGFEEKVVKAHKGRSGLRNIIWLGIKPDCARLTLKY